MSQEVFIRGIFSGIMALTFACVVFFRYDPEAGTEVSDTHRQKYLPYIPGCLLPGFLLGITVLSAVYYGGAGAARMLLSSCFGIFLHISLYYLILLLILPFLRKIISARACAMLWLIPNYLYIIHQSYMELPSPLLVFTAKGNLAWILFGIWLVGFVLVLLFKCIQHLIFRRHILRDASPVTDPEILKVWNTIVDDANFRKPKFRLVVSPVVSTPLTIGLSRRSTRVVLPEKQYSKQDLELILRHEIIHIGREDAWNKFFMVFCTAMCWFNPLMWIAMRKSADDLELSCDETVLLNKDDTERKQYAHLLLNTAADGRGFTTCLSPSARSMRYRLKSIMKPQAKYTGATLVAIAFFLLAMTSGYVALAYDGAPGSEVLCSPGDQSKYELTVMNSDLPITEEGMKLADGDGILDYLTGLEMYRITGQYSFNSTTREALLKLYLPGVSTWWLYLYDDAIEVYHLNGSRPRGVYYYIPDGIDWTYLDSLVVP